MEEFEIRIQAIKLAIEYKERIGGRYILHTYVKRFEEYIKNGTKFPE